MQIECQGVEYESSTYEDFMDLSLEITRATTLRRALQVCVRGEPTHPARLVSSAHWALLLRQSYAN